MIGFERSLGVLPALLMVGVVCGLGGDFLGVLRGFLASGRFCRAWLGTTRLHLPSMARHYGLRLPS
ncbi:hypothetical protein, partial [Stenotrophomonas sp.]|uniref:hypothetical protein n=1 Tax=Stenotrophomonas sp. TaxID=69392 RepID=UPI0028AA69C4